MDNIAHYCTLTYGTCVSIGSLYLFRVNVYSKLYFAVLPIKDLINKDGKPTTPFKLVTCTKPSISHLHVFCPGVVQKATAHAGTKALNMNHQTQKGFRGTFVGIPKHQKLYLVYVPPKHKIVSSYDVVFDGTFSSELLYVSQPYSEAMDM